MKKFLILLCFAISSFFVYTFNVHASDITDFSSNFFLNGTTLKFDNYGDINHGANNTFQISGLIHGITSSQQYKLHLEVAINPQFSINELTWTRPTIQDIKYKEVGACKYSTSAGCKLYAIDIFYTPIGILDNDTSILLDFNFKANSIDASRISSFQVKTFSITLANSTEQKQLEEQQKTNEKLDEANKNLKETNDTLKDDKTDEAKDKAGGFFNDFESDDFGLSDIITMPLTFIEGLSNGTCNSLNLPVPFVNQTIVLPCMTEIYEEYFGSFLTIYQLITTGFISYWVCVNIFRMVQNFKNPEKDEIEVMEL